MLLSPCLQQEKPRIGKKKNSYGLTRDLKSVRPLTSVSTMSTILLSSLPLRLVCFFMCFALACISNPFPRDGRAGEEELTQAVYMFGWLSFPVGGSVACQVVCPCYCYSHFGCHVLRAKPVFAGAGQPRALTCGLVDRASMPVVIFTLLRLHSLVHTPTHISITGRTTQE